MSPFPRRILRPVRLRTCCAAACLPVLLLGLLYADDSTNAKLLVLKSGRVVSGRISESAGGYIVEKPKGSMVIPFDQVAFPARDLRDAYRRMQQQQHYGAAAETYLATARWCVTYQLFDEARSELRKALELEEQNAEARLMLRRLDDVLGAPSATSAVSKQQGTGSAEAPDARSLAGLSQQTARTYVTRVQPILLHKCGNASCHGSASGNAFRLTHTTTHRVFAERNLAMTLKLVDSGRPEESPLLLVPQGNHGPHGETIFHGSIGAQQLETLRRWVLAAVEDQKKGIDRSSMLLADQTAPGPNALIRAEPAAGPEAGTPPPEDLLEKILREERADAFDPAEFNRKYHGTAR